MRECKGERNLTERRTNEVADDRKAWRGFARNKHVSGMNPD